LEADRLTFRAEAEVVAWIKTVLLLCSLLAPAEAMETRVEIGLAVDLTVVVVELVLLAAYLMEVPVVLRTSFPLLGRMLNLQQADLALMTLWPMPYQR
jgi:hypothetical protein